MNHILVRLRSLLNSLDMAFQIVQGKSGILEKKVPFLIFILIKIQGEDIPHPIINHVLGITGFTSLGMMLSLFNLSTSPLFLSSP